MLLAESDTGSTAFVVVGSANASERSATTLHEAAVVTDAADLIDDARHQLIEWKTRSTMLDAVALASLIDIYDAHVPDSEPSDHEPAVTDNATQTTSSDSAKIDDGPDAEDEVHDLEGIAYQRPKQIYFMAVTTDAHILEEAMHQAEVLAERFGASAPTDETDESPTELIVLRFDGYSQYPRSYAEGAHIVPLYTQSEHGRLNAASVAGAPGRVVSRWIDDADDGDTHYYYLLSQKSSTEIRYPDVQKAFSGISMMMEQNRGYLNPKVITAVLDLWPDLRWQ
nr:hypothetical protein [Gordonia paraffinivorans]